MDFALYNPAGSVVTWWNVKPTYDYAYDCRMGRTYAEQYIVALRQKQVRSVLPHIVDAFPQPMTGIEIGFLQGISDGLLI